MEISLRIEPSTCIRCGHCVRVCPAKIFVQANPNGEVLPEHIENCIVCGHCVAVCPTASVVHSAFPPESVHPVDRRALPTPEQTMLLVRSRRSNRAFSDGPVPQAMLGQILEAAHRAPTASNLQQVSFTLVTDPDKLHRVSELTLEVFASQLELLGNPLVKAILKKVMPGVFDTIPTLKRLIEEFAKGNDGILRGAKALILIHTPGDSRFGCEDANLAYQNGSLMAESLGVSQFYTGFVCAGIRQDKKNRIAEMLGIRGTIRAGMALGMPEFLYPNYIDREDIRLTRF